MKKSLPIVIGVALLVGIGSFYGGMRYAQAKAPARGARMGQATGGNGQFQGAAGRNGAARSGMGGFVNGDILANDGKTLTVKLRDGGSKIVFLGDTTEILKSVAGAASDLEVGKAVMVIGKTNDDGSMTAQNIQLRPAMMAPPAQAKP